MRFSPRPGTKSDGSILWTWGRNASAAGWLALEVNLAEAAAIGMDNPNRKPDIRTAAPSGEHDVIAVRRPIAERVPADEQPGRRYLPQVGTVDLHRGKTHRLLVGEATEHERFPLGE